MLRTLSMVKMANVLMETVSKSNFHEGLREILELAAATTLVVEEEASLSGELIIVF